MRPSSKWGWRMCGGLAVLIAFVALAPPLRATMDSDGDGYLEGTDCDDLDDTVWSLPGEAQNLQIAADKHTFTWAWAQDLGGTASTAGGDLLKATSPFAFASTGSCSVPSVTVSTASDTAVPTPGHAFYYLVRNRNSCGDGSLGTQSNGTPRSGATCDCSALCNDSNACTSDRCSNGACAHDPVAAVIEQSPDSIAVCPGQTAIFRVRAPGTGSVPTFAWKKNGVGVGTNSPTLTLTGVGLADNGAQITCVVTAGCAPTTSAAATLTVFASAAACAGGGTGLEAPNSASEMVADPTEALISDAAARKPFFLDGTQSRDDGRVSMHSGELHLEATDLSIAGRGLDFAWHRIYSSREGRLTPMGHNWDFSYNRYITLAGPGTLYVYGGDGRRDLFTPSVTGCYTSPGLFQELCPQVDGSFALIYPDRTTITFAALDGSPGQGKFIRIRDTDANRLDATIDSAGRMTAITDTLGRAITIAYNPDGYISSVTDFGGRTVSYEYYGASDTDGMPGDLKSVTSPPVTGTPNGGDFPDGKTTLYTYSSNTGRPALDHNLLSATRRTHHPTASDPFPDPPNCRVVYTPSTSPTDASFDRVQRVVFGDDPATAITYVYAPAVPGDEDPAVTMTVMKDRAGNVSHAYFDASNRMVAMRQYTGRAPNLQIATGPASNRPTAPLRATDPPFYRTRFAYNADSLLTEITFPELDKVQLTYDSANSDVRLRANLLQRKQLPGPRGGDQSAITESWAYATSFGSLSCPSPKCGAGSARTDILIKNMRERINDLEQILMGGGSWSHAGAKGGRVKVRFPWLPSDDGGESTWVRVHDWYWSDGAGKETFPGDKTPIVRGSALGGLRRKGAGDGGHGGGGGGGCGGMDGCRPDVEGEPGFWASHLDGNGRAWHQDVDPTTGHVLQVSAPPVTIGTPAGTVQDIHESWVYDSHGQVVQHTGPTGRVDTVTYETSGPAAGYMKSVVVDDFSPLPGAHLALLTIVARDQYGNPTAITDPNGNTETFVVNQLDQVVRYTAPISSNYSFDFTFDAANALIRVDEPNLDEASNPRPRTEVCKRMWLDALHRPLTVTEDGRCPLDATGGLKLTTEFVYEPNGGVTLVRTPIAFIGAQPTATTRIAFDERGLPYRLRRAEGDALVSTSQIDYDGDGNPVTTRDGLESTTRVTSIAYDGYNRPVTVTDPMGNVSTSHYDAIGNEVSSRVDGELVDGSSGANVRLSEMSTTYDEIGRPVQVDRAFFDAQTGMPIGDGFSTSKTYYEPDSRISRIEDDNGAGTTFTYDTARRLSTSETPAGSTGYTHDANGNVVRVTETEISDLAGTPPTVTVTDVTLDALDRTTSIAQGGVMQHLLWDSRSPGPVVRIDGRGNETRVVYDGANRPVETHRKLLDTGEAGGSVVSVLDSTMSYDPNGRLVAHTDDNGHVTTYTYDPLGRIVVAASSDGAFDTMTYDVHDNLVATTRKNGAFIAANYDYKERAHTRTVTLPGNVLGPTSEVYEYDGLSRMVSAVNDTTHVSLSYDSLSHVTREVSGGTGLPDLTVTRVYDGAGLNTSLTYPSGMWITNSYDAAPRRKSITAQGPGVCLAGPPPHNTCITAADCGSAACTPMPPVVTTLDYTGPRVVHRVNGNGTETTMTYDGRRRPMRTTTARSSPFAVLDDHQSTWDDASNRTSRTDLRVITNPHVYSYDSADRLVHSLEPSSSGGPPVTIDYTLDGAGNRLYVVGGLDPGAYVMSAALPQPADAQVNQYTTAPSSGACTYDDGGVLSTSNGGGRSLKYDFRDRLVLVSGSSGSGSFTYDALGRRMVMNGRRLVYDGEQEIEERGASGALRRATVYGNGIDEILHVVADVDSDGFPERTFYHSDDLGNVTAVTSSLGEALESYDYDDFGKPRFYGPTGATLSQSAIGNPALLQGRRYDATLGLYDFRTRTMDPRTGRFLSRDSIGEWGDPSALGNGYTFMGNNPWSGTDPTGTAKLPRSILMEFFQSGDKPTAAQFGTLIDSTINRITDRYLLGRRQYNPLRAYTPGDSVIYNNSLYGCKTNSGYHRCGDGCVSDAGPQTCGGRITKPGVDKLSSAFEVSTLWMMKLCPGHISCPTSPFPGGLDPLGYTRRGYGVNTRSDTYLAPDR